MADLGARLAIIVAVLMIAATAIWLVRKSHSRGRVVRVTGLSPGLYLFTSETCSSCHSVRERLVKTVGVDGFTEFVWEKAPDVMERLNIEEVPSTMRVAADGTGRLSPGILGIGFRDF